MIESFDGKPVIVELKQQYAPYTTIPLEKNPFAFGTAQIQAWRDAEGRPIWLRTDKEYYFSWDLIAAIKPHPRISGGSRRIMIELTYLKCEDMPLIVKWRNEDYTAARTAFPITEENQYDFYENKISNRDAPVRFWKIIYEQPIDEWKEEMEKSALMIKITDDVLSIRKRDRFSGIVGLNPISWEDRKGEISILVDPSQQNKGIGSAAFNLLLKKAFYELNLNHVHGEVYYNNPDLVKWWMHQVEKYNGNGHKTAWNTKLDAYPSYLFDIDRAGFERED